MYDVSNNFMNKIKLNDRTLDAKLQIGTSNFTDDDIVDITVEYILGNNNIPTIGSVIASKLDFTIANNNLPSIIATREIKPTIGLEITAGNFEYVPLGVFRASLENIKKTELTTHIIAYDILYLLGESPYITNLAFPATWASIKADLQSKNLVFESQTLPAVTIKEKPETIRDLLSQLGILFGMCATTNRQGQIRFKKLENVSFQTNNYNSFKLLSEEKIKFTKLVLEQAGEDKVNLEVGDNTGFAIKIKSPSINFQTELQTVFNRSLPLEYLAYECLLQGLPHLEVGDIITLVDKKDRTYQLPIVYHKLRYSGGLRSEIKAGSPAGSISSSGSYGGSITQMLNNLQINILEANRLIADKATIAQLDALYAYIEDLDVGDLTAINAYIQELEALNAKIALADINIARITYGDIHTLLAGNLDATNLKAGLITATSGLVANLAITNAMIANVNADKITAGQIDTSKVTIAGSDGHMILADNTLQINDGNKVRVQIGKDASGDYSMSLWDAQGKLMFDARGLTEDAIKEEIIRNDMIAQDANISANKIDIGSVVQSINNGVTKLESSSILYDGKQLNVAFNELETNLTDTVDKTVKTTDVEYYLSNSVTSPSGGSWQTTAPTWVNGKYMWSRTKVVLQDGTTRYSPSTTGTCIAGAKGDKGDKGDSGEKGLQGLQGPKGEQGIPGEKGADGKPSYTHIAYATNSTGTSGFSISNPTNKTYIGIYVDDKVQDSTDPTKYKWTLIKGADGSQGIPGTKGADGKTPYLHIAYATNATGTAGFSISDPTNKTYIGQYTDYVQADSTDPSKYKWSLIKGADGAKGDTGRGITSITEEYYLSTSKTTQTGGSWLTDPPTWKPYHYIWTRSKIVYNNPSGTEYTTPIVSSEWEAVNELEVGGRNLLRETSWTYYSNGTVTVNNGIIKVVSTRTSSGYSGIQQSGSIKFTLEAGQIYTLSFKVRGTVSRLNYVYIMNNSGGNQGINSKAITDVYIDSDVKFKTLVYTFTPISNTAGNNSHLMISGIALSPEWFEIKDIKLEKGNKATDWTPAPEDVQTEIETRVKTTDFEIEQGRIATLIGDIYTQTDNQGNPISSSSKVSTLQQTVDGFSTEVSNLETKVSRKPDHYFYAVAPTLSNAPAKDWTTNAIKDQHLNDLYTNTVTGYVYRFIKTGSVYSWVRIKDKDINTIEDTINISQYSSWKQNVDSIESRVSNTYTTKQEFNALEIGGRNLLRNGDFNQDLNFWNLYRNPSISFLEEDFFKKVIKVTTNQSNSGIMQEVNSIVYNDVYTISFWAKAQGATTISFNNSRSLIESIHLSEDWKEFSITFVPTTTRNLGIFSSSISVFYLANIKFEKGNKATDWTPAPEDIQAEIETLNTSITQTNNAISLKADKTVTNGLETRLTTAESKITPTAITQTVEQTSNVLAKKSEVNQLNDKIVTRFDTGNTSRIRYIRSWLNCSSALDGSSYNSDNTWYQLVVKAGSTNVAAGKPVTSNFTPLPGYSLSRYTDGSTNSSFVEGAKNQWSYLQVDLGSIRSDITEIIDYHYAWTTRYWYYKLEVSADGENWTSLYDGRLLATSSGKSFKLNQQSGIITQSLDGIRVEHSGTNQYSEIRADGFVRKWQYGEANYLNDIWVDTFEFEGIPSPTRPDYVQIILPSRFRERQDKIEVLLSFSDMSLIIGSVNSRGDMITLTTRIRTVLDYRLRDFDTSSPKIEVNSYFIQDFTDKWGYADRDYGLLGFTVVVIGG